MTVRVRDANSGTMRAEFFDLLAERFCIHIMNGSIPTHEIKAKDSNKKAYICDDDRVYKFEFMHIYLWEGDQLIVERN